MIQTEDYVPVGDFTPLGIRQSGGGNGYLSDEALFYAGRSVLSSSTNFDGLIQLDQLNGEEDFEATFGRPDRNATEVANGLMLRDNNSFLLLGHTGDTNDVSRPTLIYVDRFGNETDRIVLGELDFSTGQLSFTPASDGGVFIMALTNNGFRLTRLNPAGETLWSQLLPVGNTPNATEIAELPDGNLLALDSRFDLQTTAGFPVIVRLLDSNGDELSSFSNNSISLGYDRQLLVTPDSLIYLSGRDYLLRSGYLTAYRYGTEVPLWTTALTTPGFLMHGASDPSLHPDGAVGIILRGEAPTGTNNNSLLSYVKINDQGEEVGRTMLSDEWDSGVVRTSSQADSRTISFGITKNNGIDSGRHFIRVIDLDYLCLSCLS